MAVKIITMEIVSIYKVGKLRENASAASLAVKGKKRGHSSTALIVMLWQSKKPISESFPNIQRPISEGNCCINPETGL